MPSFKQDSFAGGIIGPQLLGKTTQSKYQSGLRECLNFLITKFASAENRPGTRYIGEVKTSSAKVREIPFIFNSSISYMLEFGASYIRPWNQGARISVTGAAAYAGGTTYGIGDLVTSVGIVYWSIQAGNVGHTPASNPTYWYPQANDLLEIKTAIPQNSLALLQYVQQNDVMTVVQQAFAPQQLIRYSNTKWAWQAFTQSTGIEPPDNVLLTIGVGPSPTPAAPTGLTAVGGNGLSPKDHYVVTAYFAPVGGEGAQSSEAISTVGAADAGNPVALAWTAVGGADGYVIYKTLGIIGVADTNAYTDNGIVAGTTVKMAPGTAPGNTTFTYVVTAVSATTGAESLVSAEATGIGRTPTDAHPNTISWDAVADAASYNVYRIVNAIPGFIGSTAAGALSFSDTNIQPDTAIQPPTPLTLFSTSSDYPAAVGYYQQRLLFGNTINEPQTVDASNVGNPDNFTVATPVTDDAAVSFTIAGKQVQEVRAIIDLGKLILHTSADEYVATGNQAGALTPTGIGLVHQGSAGCATIAPIIIGNIGLFVQARGSLLRDLEYSIYSTSFKGRDLTVFAPHLFVGRTIVDMAWQQIPNSIVWCVMSDGALLGLTYIKDHDIWAWHRHDSDGGLFENVVVVPEGQEDVTYFVVKRTVDGSTVRYIERLESREFTDISGAWFVDCGLGYDGRNTGGTTMTATTGGGWTPQDSLTLTASATYFVLGDVGNEIVFQEIAADGSVTDAVGFEIIAYVSDTQVTVQADRDVPAWAQVALTTWGKATDHFTGLDHLEGETVSGLGDGNAIPQAVVSGGAITTAINYLVLTVGLPITADLETLPTENQQGESIANKRVVLTETTPIFYNSRGGKYGQDFDHLKPFIQRQSENWNDPVTLATGPRRIPIQGSWQATGQLCLRQEDPLPIGLSAIITTGSVGNV